MLLVALNHACDKHSIGVMLLLRKVGKIWVSGDGLLSVASLVACGLIEAKPDTKLTINGLSESGRVIKSAEAGYEIGLSAKGGVFVAAWMEGRQPDAVGALGS